MTPSEQNAIRYLFVNIANSPSYHRHRELFGMIKGRSNGDPFISNACLRHAAIAYSAYIQADPSLMKSSWSSFQFEIRKVTRNTVDMDHMHGFLLMTHLSRRQGAWLSVTQYLKNFTEILQDVLNGRINVMWDTETTLIETIWSARGFNRARPLTGDFKEDAITYLDALNINMDQCSTLVAGQDLNNSLKRTILEKKLVTLMLYNQDILHSIESCFAQTLRALLTESISHFEICRKKLRELRDRWKILEQDPSFQQLKVMDWTFTFRRFQPQLTAFGRNIKFYGWTEIDPVAEDFRALGQDPYISVEDEFVRESISWFKKTSGGLRKLIWARHSRNTVLLSLLEYLIQETCTSDYEDAAAKLAVIAADCAVHFPLHYKYVVELALYGFSLAELRVRFSESHLQGIHSQ